MEVSISPDIYESPYLKSIQWLNGQKPGEKYRHLNAFIQGIVKICRETGVSSADVISTRQQEIPAALLPLVRIITGIELKLTDAVVEGLKSPDIVVVNKALRAKWFFDGSNSHVDAPYFMENIFPFVSVRTRMDIVKALTRGLYDAKEKAENFFNLFYNMYSLEQAMPFLPYCSENFIFDVILRFKIVLSFKMLDTIFQRYPNLAIRYLYLGSKDFGHNEANKKIHTINLSAYVKFLPKLIKKHIHDYLNLLSCVNNNVNIGSKRRRALFKNGKDFVMKRTNIFNSNWLLKYIYYNLSKPEFEEYYASLHPKKSHQYNFTKMFNYLKYYPKDSRIDFMKCQYERIYKEYFFSHLDPGINNISALFNDGKINEEQFETLYSAIFPRSYSYLNFDNLILNLKYYSNEKMLNLLHKNLKERNFPDLLKVDHALIRHYESEKYLLLLPDDEKSKKAQHLISFHEKRTDGYYKWCCFLPVEQSFNILKVGAESSSAQKRCEFLKKMIYSCKVYNNETHLNKVLNYYIQRHKNEQSSILHSILEYLMNQFNILALHDANWQLFCEIVETAYIKNELFNAPEKLVNNIFEESLHRLLIESEQQIPEGESSSLREMIHKYLEYKIIYQDDTDWTIFESKPDLEDKFIKIFMFYIPIKYPENHLIWKEDDKIEKVGSKIIYKLHKRNENIINNLKSQERNAYDLNTTISRVINYTWLMEISDHLLRKPNSKNPKYLESFKALMQTFDKEFYLSVIPNDVRDDAKNNILSGKALWTLKNNSTSIQNYWKEYLNTVRNMLQSNSQGAQAAKNFVLSIKWHQELPLRFIDCCVHEIDKPGSLMILALLMDGETLSKLLFSYIPSQPTVDIQKISAKEAYQITSFIPSAINLSRPFVSTEILMSMLQGEYTKLGQRSIRSFGQRVDKPSVVNFAKQLFNRPVSVKKHGIRLMFSVCTNDEIVDFFTELSKCKQHPTINMIIAHRILILFIKHPNEKTWNLLNNFMDSLGCTDILALKVLSDTKLIRNPYASLYLKKLLSKIEDLDEQSKLTKTEQKMEVSSKELSLKESLIKAVFENVSEESVMFLTKKTIIDILQKYYFKADTRVISQSTINFANKVFSRPFIGRK